MRKTLMVAFCMLSLTSAVFVAGCEDPTKSTYHFSNQSSYRVYVTPNGQTSWSSFFLDSGTSLDIKIDDSHIYYTYTPSNRVLAENQSGGDIVFVNR